MKKDSGNFKSDSVGRSQKRSVVEVEFPISSEDHGLFITLKLGAALKA